MLRLPAAGFAALFLCHPFWLSPAAAQPPARTQLRGTVATPTGKPVWAAEVSILGDSLTTLTDSAGRFVLREIPPGTHVVRVRRIGFRPQYLAAKLESGEEKDVLIALTPGAYELPELRVTAREAKPIEYAWTTKYEDFFRRKRVGLGYYISREDIDRKRSVETASLLVGVPGIRFKFGAPGRVPNEITTTRCDFLSVWVDGWELNPNLVKRLSPKPMEGDPKNPQQVTGALLETILPIQIEMIEVYTSPARGQAEFVGSSCGAIMIWTR
ncbi:MAG: carboxypeptidase-like regulatory domain-containing protein [Gemmatimonadales bacterium]